MNSMHVISPEKQKISVDTEFYNKKGIITVDSTEDILASSIINTRNGHKTYKYYITYNNYGPESGQPVNPQSNHEDARGITYNTQMGRQKHELREVKKQKFDLYIKFLKTQNTGYLRELERII